jgi:circadian clock protein KaiB
VTEPQVTLRWVLTLCVSDASPRSSQAIDTIRRICDEDLAGRIDLSIVDAHEHPLLVVGDQVLAVPTLVKQLPSPLRRLVGDLSDANRIRVALDLGAHATSERLLPEELL